MDAQIRGGLRVAILDRIAVYGLCAVLALLVYIACDFIFTELDPVPASVMFNLGFAFVFSIVDGFAPALALMCLPWILVVWGYRPLRRWGQVYFSVNGAVLAFVIGCAAASLAPKPLFIEDQTFLEGAKIAAERQGISFILAGATFGLSYWFFNERQGAVFSRKNKVSHS
jgi:hypothetical protein